MLSRLSRSDRAVGGAPGVTGGPATGAGRCGRLRRRTRGRAARGRPGRTRRFRLRVAGQREPRDHRDRAEQHHQQAGEHDRQGPPDGAAWRLVDPDRQPGRCRRSGRYRVPDALPGSCSGSPPGPVSVSPGTAGGNGGEPPPCVPWFQPVSAGAWSQPLPAGARSQSVPVGPWAQGSLSWSAGCRSAGRAGRWVASRPADSSQPSAGLVRRIGFDPVGWPPLVVPVRRVVAGTGVDGVGRGGTGAERAVVERKPWRRNAWRWHPRRWRSGRGTPSGGGRACAGNLSAAVYRGRPAAGSCRRGADTCPLAPEAVGRRIRVGGRCVAPGGRGRVGRRE